MYSKTNIYLTILLACIALNACKKDKTNNPGGVAGFEGVYQVRENCMLNGYSGYSIKITPSSGVNQVYIYNFFNLGSSKYIFGEVDGLLININPQSVAGFTVFGKGNMNGSSLILDYKIDDGVLLDSCTANCIRQQ